MRIKNHVVKAPDDPNASSKPCKYVKLSRISCWQFVMDVNCQFLLMQLHFKVTKKDGKNGENTE